MKKQDFMYVGREIQTGIIRYVAASTAGRGQIGYSHRAMGRTVGDEMNWTLTKVPNGVDKIVGLAWVSHNYLAIAAGRKVWVSSDGGISIKPFPIFEGTWNILGLYFDSERDKLWIHGENNFLGVDEILCQVFAVITGPDPYGKSPITAMTSTGGRPVVFAKDPDTDSGQVFVKEGNIWEKIGFIPSTVQRLEFRGIFLTAFNNKGQVFRGIPSNYVFTSSKNPFAEGTDEEE